MSALAHHNSLRQSLKRVAAGVAGAIDPVFAEMSSRLGRVERGTLRAICLHAVKDSHNASPGVAEDFETERAEFKTFVESFLVRGYTFITPRDLLAPLDATGRYVMVTFDDGYFSAKAAADIMAEYGLRMTLFVTPYYTEHGRAHWNDILFRGAEAHRMSPAARRTLTIEMRQLPQPERERRLTELFGPESLKPIGDKDRTLTAEEVRALSATGNVEVGNHTWSHVDLTARSDEDIDTELSLTQAWVRAATGTAPTALAFPYGRCDSRTIAAAERFGFTSVFTTETIRHPLSALATQPFKTIGRFGSWIPGRRPLGPHVLRMRCGDLLSDRLMNWRARRGGGR